MSREFNVTKPWEGQLYKNAGYFVNVKSLCTVLLFRGTIKRLCYVALCQKSLINIVYILCQFSL